MGEGGRCQASRSQSTPHPSTASFPVASRRSVCADYTPSLASAVLWARQSSHALAPLAGSFKSSRASPARVLWGHSFFVRAFAILLVSDTCTSAYSIIVVTARCCLPSHIVTPLLPSTQPTSLSPLPFCLLNPPNPTAYPRAPCCPLQESRPQPADS